MYVLVLNDGETYTNLRGAMILRIDDKLANYPDLDGIIKDAADAITKLGWRRPSDTRVELVTAFE
jgi:hypothetical protein